MIVRADHVAGGGVRRCRRRSFSRSAATCRSARLSSPGAGMMPKLMVGLMMAFGAILVACGGAQPAVRRRSTGATSGTPLRWSRSPAAPSRSTPALGFVAHHVAAAVRAAVRRRAPQPAGAPPPISIGVTVGSPTAVRHAAEIAAADHGRALVLAGPWNHPRQPAARLLGRAAAGRAALRVSRLPGRHPGRHAARHRTARRHQHPAAGDLRPRRHQGDRHAGRHLLRLAVRRLDHLDPDAHSGRGRLGDDLHRRLRHGAEGPRRRGALHRRGRLVHRRHVRRHHADRGGAAARRHSRCASGRRNTPRCSCSA